MTIETASDSNEKTKAEQKLEWQSVGLSRWFLNEPKNDVLDCFCRGGHVHTWAKNVEHAFARNRDSILTTEWCESRPTDWSHIGPALGMNKSSITRYPNYRGRLKNASTPQTPEAVMSHKVAWTLGVDGRTLLPTTSEWISSTARLLLIQYLDPQDRWIGIDDDVAVYGYYLSLQFPLDASSLEKRCFRSILDDFRTYKTEFALEQAVLHCAIAIGKVLTETLKWKRKP